MTEQPTEDFILLSNEQEDALLSTQPLNSAHRCDGCGAQAYVLVSVGTGRLLFCGHHFKKAGDAVTIIRDDREKLLARSEPAFTGV